MKSVLFLGYHSLGAACLRILLEEADARVVGVFTHREDPSENIWFDTPRRTALAAGIPVYYPERLGPEETELVRRLQPDIIVSVYYRLMVPQRILGIPPLGAVNLHGSLLPRYRGRVPVNWTIINAESVTGVTLHYMVKEPDAGDIIARAAVPVSPYDTARSLFDKINAAGAELFRENLPLLLSEKAPHTPQDASAATYFGGRRPEDGIIDWLLPAERIYNLVRAVTIPYPGAFTFLPGGGKLTIWWAAPAPDDTAKAAERLSLEPGSAAMVDGEVIAACGEGTYLRLIDVEETAADEWPSGKGVRDAAKWFLASPAAADGVVTFT